MTVPPTPAAPTESWWAGIPATQLSIDCAGATHRLRWADGELLTLDHGDAAGERTLAALGGAPNPCIDLLDAWTRHSDDLDVLLLASRGPADPLGSPRDGTRAQATGMRFVSLAAFSSIARAQTPRRGATPVQASASIRARRGPQRGWTLYSPLSPGLSTGPALADPGDDLVMLLGLGSGLPHRLAATVIAIWSDRIDQNDSRIRAATPALHAALYGRSAAAVSTWLDDTNIAVTVTMCAPGHAATAVRDSDTVSLTLPFRWLSEVWARGYATLSGRFCLSAHCIQPSNWTLTTVDPDFSPPHPITLDLT